METKLLQYEPRLGVKLRVLNDYNDTTRNNVTCLCDRSRAINVQNTLINDWKAATATLAITRSRHRFDTVLPIESHRGVGLG
jgi:hypothetical protein